MTTGKTIALTRQTFVGIVMSLLFNKLSRFVMGCPGGSEGKHLPAMRETRVWSLGWEDPRRRKWQPTPVLLPGRSHEWKSLVSYRPWGHKELDTTEWLHFHFTRFVIAFLPRSKHILISWLQSPSYQAENAYLKSLHIQLCNCINSVNTKAIGMQTDEWLALFQ